MSYDDHKKLASASLIEEQKIYWKRCIEENKKLLTAPRSMLVIRMLNGGITSLTINVQFYLTTWFVPGHSNFHSIGILVRRH